MVLHALAGREPQLLIRQRGDPVEGQPLLARDHAARHRGAHHAGVVERQLELRAGTTNVAVVLLVDPVELEEQFGVVVEVGGVVDEFRSDRAPEVVALELDLLGTHKCSPHSVLSEPAHRPAR